MSLLQIVLPHQPAFMIWRRMQSAAGKSGANSGHTLLSPRSFKISNIQVLHDLPN